MTIFKKGVALAAMAAIFIGCADEIDGPRKISGVSAGNIVNNKAGSQSDIIGDMEITLVDGLGGNPTKIADGVVIGTGEDAILYFVPRGTGYGGQADIYLANRSGSNAQRIVSIDEPGQQIEGFPVISENGERIAYLTRDSVSPSYVSPSNNQRALVHSSTD